jgi:pimeloyl-ACP methyl ester carboxylesterase
VQLPLEGQVTAVWPKPPVRDRLGELRLPTLVIVGSEDVPDIRAIAELLAGSIPGARLEEIAGAGHLPSLERPDELNRLLLDFL